MAYNSAGAHGLLLPMLAYIYDNARSRYTQWADGGNVAGAGGAVYSKWCFLILLKIVRGVVLSIRAVLVWLWPDCARTFSRTICSQ